GAGVRAPHHPPRRVGVLPFGPARGPVPPAPTKKFPRRSRTDIALCNVIGDQPRVALAGFPETAATRRVEREDVAGLEVDAILALELDHRAGTLDLDARVATLTTAEEPVGCKADAVGVSGEVGTGLEDQKAAKETEPAPVFAGAAGVGN